MKGNDIVKTLIGLPVLLLAALPALAGAEITSDPTFVIVQPEQSSFWSTMPSHSVNVSIDFPKGSEQAVLTVSGNRGQEYIYNIGRSDLEDGGYVVELPDPANETDEDVWTFSVVYVENNPTHPPVPKTAKAALLSGVVSGTQVITRCIVPKDGKEWNKVRGGHAVIPVPYGTTSLTLNGNPVDTGLDGAQGWYYLNTLPAGLTLTTEGGVYSALLVGQQGFIMSIE